MAGGTGAPDWLVSLGEAVASAGSVLWFLINRYDRMVDTAKADHDKATTAIDMARTEAAEALSATTQRMDARHEALRIELSGKVDQLAARIDNQTRDMATKADLQPIVAAINKLSDRIDQRFDRAR